MTMGAYKMVFAVRRDLKLGPGKLAVQVAHAAVALALQNAKARRKEFDAWLDDGQKKVVVRVEGLEQLHRLKSDAEARGLPTSLVQDAGLTEVPPGTVTCLGIGPARDREMDPITGALPLV